MEIDAGFDPSQPDGVFPGEPDQMEYGQRLVKR
jgi:hypothetical protein